MTSPAALPGRVAPVTSASRRGGIGFAIAERLGQPAAASVRPDRVVRALADLLRPR